MEHAVVVAAAVVVGLEVRPQLAVDCRGMDECSSIHGVRSLEAN